MTKHGHSKRGRWSKIYRAWADIIQRCTNSNNKQWKNYGGRGIIICDRWLYSFTNFLKDMGKPPGSEYSIDRIDNNKGYYKENCQWATPKQQARNTRKNRLVTHNGKTQCISIWRKNVI